MSKEKARELDRLIEIVVASIPKEREARDLYRSAARDSNIGTMKILFEKLAADEQDHEARLDSVLEYLQQERAKTG